MGNILKQCVKPPVIESDIIPIFVIDEKFTELSLKSSSSSSSSKSLYSNPNMARYSSEELDEIMCSAR